MRLTEVVIEEGIVFELRKLNLLGIEVERPLENAERLVFVEEPNGQKIAHLKDEAFGLLT